MIESIQLTNNPIAVQIINRHVPVFQADKNGGVNILYSILTIIEYLPGAMVEACKPEGEKGQT